MTAEQWMPEICDIIITKLYIWSTPPHLSASHADYRLRCVRIGNSMWHFLSNPKHTIINIHVNEFKDIMLCFFLFAKLLRPLKSIRMYLDTWMKDFCDTDHHKAFSSLHSWWFCEACVTCGWIWDTEKRILHLRPAAVYDYFLLWLI